MKSILEEWKRKYPDSYRDSFAAEAVPVLFAPFVRLEVQLWDPLFGSEGSSRSFEEQEWYRLLFDYGMGDGAAEVGWPRRCWETPPLTPHSRRCTAGAEDRWPRTRVDALGTLAACLHGCHAGHVGRFCVWACEVIMAASACDRYLLCAAQDDPDADLMPRLVEQLALPFLLELARSAWDPADPKQAGVMAAAVSDMLVYLPPDAAGLGELLTHVQSQLRCARGRLRHVRCPHGP